MSDSQKALDRMIDMGEKRDWNTEMWAENEDPRRRKRRETGRGEAQRIDGVLWV